VWRERLFFQGRGYTVQQIESRRLLDDEDNGGAPQNLVVRATVGFSISLVTTCLLIIIFFSTAASALEVALPVYDVTALTDRIVSPLPSNGTIALCGPSSKVTLPVYAAIDHTGRFNAPPASYGPAVLRDSSGLPGSEVALPVYDTITLTCPAVSPYPSNGIVFSSNPFGVDLPVSDANPFNAVNLIMNPNNPAGQLGQQTQGSGMTFQGQQVVAMPNGMKMPIYRPADMEKLPLLSDEEKVKYERGLSQMYRQIEAAPPGSALAQESRKRVMDFSRMLFNKMNTRRPEEQQRLRAGQQIPPSQAAQLQADPAKPQIASANASTSTIAPNPATSGQIANASAVPAAGAAGSQPGAAQPVKIPNGIMTHVNQMTYNAPPQIVAKGAEEAQKWSTLMKQKYIRALMAMEQARTRVSQADATMKDRQEKGNPLNDAEMKSYNLTRQENQKQYSEAHKFVDAFRKNQEAQNKTGNSNQPGAGAGTRPQEQSRPGVPSANAPSVSAAAASNTSIQTPQDVTATVHAAIEAAKNPQVAAGNRGPGASGIQIKSQPAQVPVTAASQPTSLPSQPAAPATQPQIKLEQPHPPPVNTAIATAAQLPSAGTPTRNSVQTPQTANTPTTAGPARPLTHQAALSLANQRASQPNSAQLPNQASSGTPSSGGAIASTVMSASQQGHPHAHPTQNNATMSSKMPIPRELPEKSQAVPQPVGVGGGVAAGRPTMTGGAGMGGVMSQPAVYKIPAYTHEAEGDHVLSKKKLDELVRQVAGGTADGEGNLLSPEVEEVSALCFALIHFATKSVHCMLTNFRRASSTWPTPLSTTFLTRPAATPRSAALRHSTSATCS
jgi:transcription initiation factor TFIID subunit 12